MDAAQIVYQSRQDGLVIPSPRALVPVYRINWQFAEMVLEILVKNVTMEMFYLEMVAALLAQLKISGSVAWEQETYLISVAVMYNI